MIIEWTEPARLCLQEIAEHIAQDSITAAYDLIEAIEASTKTTLTDHPNAGRPGRVEGTREWVAHKSYVVAYRVAKDRVQVLSVIHSARLWASTL